MGATSRSLNKASSVWTAFLAGCLTSAHTHDVHIVEPMAETIPQPVEYTLPVLGERVVTASDLDYDQYPDYGGQVIIVGPNGEVPMVPVNSRPVYYDASAVDMLPMLRPNTVFDWDYDCSRNPRTRTYEEHVFCTTPRNKSTKVPCPKYREAITDGERLSCAEGDIGGHNQLLKALTEQ
jgi:hypothetical protein